ncbi:UNVERIFIED_ORG: polar amino acid transport system substrate-binding protein [Rhizobium esperanzae]|uniref:Amino acid ABC transporter substrate-binding protein n=1 Tax=Rhizobium phaseoli TaxID=396 RepID=A0A192T4M1_9HYPH|nr:MULTISPECIES: amino acid ABC transporter substrate-binding protein [Rhizobium]MDH6647099.1 polar amino acid transport system substrate-binding protein [Rhizobium esperanzae]ANL38575.1 amino acid ABC transporter substrate-binding protein [Rhizobium phaseoli]ANL51324.1 amino acid ABC transporter substrate-binding protein [Rhizobium phaseoli]ANL57564.1 amino acid ABC transporter substrate-binding protein [Rhizobium phaseoli]ANL82956.1 amino acid ABC transporter substrate-binding protein [Rhizo
MSERNGRWAAIAASVLAAAVVYAVALPAQAQTLDRVRTNSALKLGYDPDARPFSFDAQGKPDGYAVALCNRIADSLRAQLNLSKLDVEWVPLSGDAKLRAIQDGTADLVCAAEPVTLGRRQQVSFSLPIFPSGTGALLNASAPLALREILQYGEPSSRPVWRGAPARTILEHKTFSSIAGTTSEEWLSGRIKTFQLAATATPVTDYQQGIERILDGSSAVLFGDMPLLMDAAARSDSSGNLIVLERHFTYEPLGLELTRGDEDFRLAVDRALSQAYAAENFRAFFTTWFGPPDDAVVTFFRQTALPE